MSSVLVDTDVDAADLHLLLVPRVREVHAFAGGHTLSIDPASCAGCAKCAQACHFDAIRMDGPGNDFVGKTYRIDALACEGCGLCALVCPVDAIMTHDSMTGEWFVSVTDYGPMVHARLGMAEENSGRLVAQVRARAADIAREQRLGRILSDGPPGTGCPVIASVSGTDVVLVVTEPTVSGVHDMARVRKLAAHFGTRALVLINKADLNAEQAGRILDIAARFNAPVVGRIPFDPTVNEALSAGRLVVEYSESPAARAIRDAWTRVEEVVREEGATVVSESEGAALKHE